MLQTCPACHSENRDTAKFCDQCAAPLSPSVIGEAQAALSRGVITAQGEVGAGAETASQTGLAFQRRGSTINWTALLYLALIVLVIVWVIKTPSNKQPPAPMAGAAGDNPIGTMENVQKQLNELKAQLKKDPMDVAALSDLYMMYGQIGQTEKVRPYMDSALKAWKKKFPKPDSAALKILAGLALVALQANDEDAAALVLVTYHEADPTNLGVIGTIGNLYYEMERPADAVRYYAMYLERATPKEQGSDYWNILVDKATMHLNLAGEDVNSPDYAKAMELLMRATKESPEHWAAWYNLGQAHKTAGAKDKALAAFRQSLAVATDEQNKYESQKEINALEGKAPPEPPANPHEGMDMKAPGGGVSLPKPPPGTPNPHTEGGGDGT